MLATLNINIKVFNNSVGELVPSSTRMLVSGDENENIGKNELQCPVELLICITGKVALPDHQISLNNGWEVILLQNIQTKNTHENRAGDIVESMSGNIFHLYCK